ncbi:DNA polymerase III subunit delta' [Motilimonas pumila]|uniref:DNA polymerase III subunit delta' n=1 Tax=Motilimonas pumila TaxID=2303987 RepID=A0A418YCL8_9GAMM|nr:DNA polymerase III subunit delta' [Motilimonas pumila]RJG42260.1 DNA polymerase III subunit delta' [Motilimonas pumila]
MIFPWLEPIAQQLAQQYRAAHLHHGLLFCGIKGLGKQALALNLSQLLLCENDGLQSCGFCHSCELFKAGTHPDFHRLADNDKHHISIDDIRSLNKVMAERSQQGGSKVVVIDNAENFNESSANAILKTLEEPSANSYLILQCESLGRLMATITSRCQKITLSAPSFEQTQAWLAQQGVGHSLHSGLFHMHQGAPLALLAALQGEEALTYLGLAPKMDEYLKGKTAPFEVAGYLHNHKEQGLTWLYYWLQDVQKLSLGANQRLLVFAEHASSILQVANQLTVSQVYHLSAELLALQQAFRQQSGLNQELLISQFLLKIKHLFGAKQ